MLHQTFPTLIFQEKLKIPADLKISAGRLRDQIEAESYKFAQLDEAGHRWCEENNYFGYTSYGSLPQIYNYSSTFQDLELCLRQSVKKYIRQLQYDISLRDLQINSMWMNIMPEGGFHTGHVHPLSVISGTYYVKLKNDSSSIKFEDPRLTNFMNQPLKKKQSGQKSPYHVEIAPGAHDVILFESWLRHEVPVSLSKEDRISISFNYGWSNHGNRNTASKTDKEF